MNILLLGPERKELMEFIASFGDAVKYTSDKITADCELIQWADFLISYGYNHIIRKSVLDRFPRHAINLHISYLPWCRGAYPNLWSFVYDTPKGVTIHYLDSSVDTGDILVQERVDYEPDDTLRTSYNRLIEAMDSLFRRHWADIKAGEVKAVAQPEGFPTYRERDRKQFEHLLCKGWGTPVSELIGAGLEKHLD